MFDSAGDAPGEDLCVLGSARELAALPAQAIGKIRTTTGSVTVTRAGGVVVQGNVGDLVYQGDVIETAADGAVVIIFNDGTAFNLASDARMVLDEFVCGPDGASNSARLSITRGMFNFIAGKVAKTGGLSIDTPCARIRAAARGGGTGFVTLAALTFSVIQDIQAAIQDHDHIELQDTQFGIVDIYNKLTGERLALDSPAESLQIDPSGTVTRIALTSSQVASLFDASVAAYGIQQLGQQAGVLQQRADLQGAATGAAPVQSEVMFSARGRRFCWLIPHRQRPRLHQYPLVNRLQPPRRRLSTCLCLSLRLRPRRSAVSSGGAATEDVAVNPARQSHLGRRPDRWWRFRPASRYARQQRLWHFHIGCGG